MKITIQAKPTAVQQALLSELYQTDYYKKAFLPYVLESKQVLLSQSAVYAEDEKRLHYFRGKIEMLTEIATEMEKIYHKRSKQNTEMID